MWRRLTALMRRRGLLAALGVLIAAALGVAVCVYWNAARTLQQAGEQVREANSIRFRSSTLSRPVRTGITSFHAPSQFLDAAVYRGEFYLAGPSALWRYHADGTLAAAYAVGQELPVARLTALAVGQIGTDAEPALWIATQGEGLLSFDGESFRQIAAEQARLRKLTCLLPLATGQILLGADRDGVLAYDGREIRLFHPELAGLPVTALAGSDADVWIGTRDRGLLRLRAGQVTAVGEAQGLPDRQVLSIAARGATAFAGTALGTAEVSGDRVQRVLAPDVLAEALWVDQTHLVIGSLDQGIATVPLPTSRHVRQQSTPAGVKRFLSASHKLFAVADGGLYENEAGDWRPVLSGEAVPLSDSNISALSVDPQGRLWVGYFDRGLDILEPGGRRISHREDETIFCVNRIVQNTARGTTAVGTANGLVLFDQAGQPQQVLTRADGLIANHVTDIVAQPDRMTVATPAGLTMIDASGARSLYAFHGLVNNHVYSIAARGQELWAGTLGGVSVLRDGLVRSSFTAANSRLAQNWISAVVPVGNEWWIGSYGAGIYRYDQEGRWQTFPDLPRKFEVNANAMLVTDCCIYAGTLDRGLLAYSRASGRWTALREGLPSRNVTALAGSGGSVYVGTDDGLVRLEERSLPLQ